MTVQIEYTNDYIDIDHYDLTDYDFSEIYSKEDLPDGLFDLIEERQWYTDEYSLLDYQNVSYQDAVFNAFLKLFNQELQKEIPEIELVQKKSGSDICIIDIDENIITDYYNKNIEDISKETHITAQSIIKETIEHIIKKLDPDVRALREKAEESVDKKEYTTINIDALNEIVKFEPEIESIDEFKNYRFKEIEKIDDEEVPVYTWVADAPGQMKLQFEDFKSLNLKLTKLLERLEK